MALHKDLTGADLHEPKGVATAAAGSVYTADGAGSGVWSIIDIPEGTFTMQHKLYTSAGSTSWSKPSNLMFVRVFLQGGGRGNNAGATNGTGGTSSFGSHVTATGGNASLQSTGDLNSEYITYLPWAYYNAHADISPVDDEYAGNWALKVISASALASTVTVTVGAGADGNPSGSTNRGSPGLVYIEEYIQV